MTYYRAVSKSYFQIYQNFDISYKVFYIILANVPVLRTDPLQTADLEIDS